MLRGKNKVSYLMLGFLILGTVFVMLGLPNGKFNWTAVAQYFGGDLPANVSDRYISNAGVQVFRTKQNNIEVWGACYQDGSNTKCNEIGRFAVTSLKPGKEAGAQVFTRTDKATGWKVTVFYLGTEGTNTHIYQINVYNNSGGLVDDRLVLRIIGSEVAFTTR